MTQDNLIRQILDREWAMFSNVENVGGPAACQSDKYTFEIMRSSQMKTWNEPILSSYLNDLINAELDGRNLMTEKYARMMEFTFPEEYENIRQHLPILSKETYKLIDHIVEVHIKWAKIIESKYPFISNSGRPVSRENDSENQTSIETYLRCELCTYSAKTIILYNSLVLEYEKENKSLVEEELTEQVKQFGYSSLKEGNESNSQNR